MANMHLINGHGSSVHVAAADDSSLNAAIFGTSKTWVLNRGNKFALTVVSNNTIRIADGDLMIQGRHVRITEGTYVDLSIANGSQGYKRNDLIVARYTKDSSTGVEEVNLVVIKGTASTGTASDPSYTNADIITNHAALADFPLYRISLDGINIASTSTLFTLTTKQLTDCLVSGDIASWAKASSKPSYTYSDVGAAAASHAHAGTDITSGTISSDRLPTVPVSKGGTGSTTAAAALTALGAAAASHNHSGANITSGTVAVARGGTGLSVSPSMLTNLAITSAANVLQASPRPGVTGILPIANGGTGQSSGNAALKALLAAGATVLSSYQYGTSLPTAGTAGRIFFLKR